MPEYSIKVRNLEKVYHQQTGDFRLKDINIDVENHQFITILGPSGCGKSVLLNLLCGIEKPTSGTIEFNGKIFDTGVPASFRKNFGFAFQEDNLLDWRTVENNLMFSMECFRLKKKLDCAARVDEVLHLVGLEKFKTAYPHELSGGMKQRVVFARALMHDPDILLLDQPFGALDAITRKILNYELHNIWKTTKKTVIMVTNSVEEALLLSSKAIFLCKNPDATIKTQVEIDIPVEERGANITEYSGYAKLKEKMDCLVHNLNISTGNSQGSVEV